MDWPTAFVLVAIVIATFAYISWRNYLEAEIMKEAIRHGATSIRLK